MFSVNNRGHCVAVCAFLVSSVAGCGGGPTDGGSGLHLEFVEQPGGAVAGVPFARQPVVEVRDGNGGLATGSRTISLTLVSNAAIGGLSGQATAITSGGRATFSGLSVDAVGSGYELMASAEGVEPAHSVAFVVTGPISAQISEVIAPASLLLVADTMTVTLRARDAAGTPLTRGGSAVTFGLSGGTSAGTFGGTTDRGDGTYTSLFTSTGPGSPVAIHAMIDGTATGSSAPTLAVLAFASVSAGQRHTCGVTTTSQLLCWGENASGQLGIVPESSTRPVLVSSSLEWTDVFAGHRNTCGLAQGAAYCWGNNEYSQVGNGTWSVRQDEPASVSGGLAFNRLEVGLGHTTTSVLTDQGFVVCGISSTAQAYCWGDGRFGQIGNGDVGEQAVPTPVSGAFEFGAVATGSVHSCGITTSGQPLCWGVNANGQLGIGNSPLSETCDGLSCSTTPRFVSTTRSFQSESMVVGTDHSCALSNGAAYCWGANRFGALGDGTGTHRTTPVAVSGGLSFAALTAGDALTCGLATNGSTYCWGRISGGLVPKALGGGVIFTQIDAGWSHACGTTSSGVVYCWGNNLFGQLGNGTTSSSTVPVRIRLQ